MNFFDNRVPCFLILFHFNQDCHLANEIMPAFFASLWNKLQHLSGEFILSIKLWSCYCSLYKSYVNPSIWRTKNLLCFITVAKSVATLKPSDLGYLRYIRSFICNFHFYNVTVQLNGLFQNNQLIKIFTMELLIFVLFITYYYLLTTLFHTRMN